MSKHLLLATALAATISATAQDTAQRTLDEVVVTANKFENKSSNTGKVVTVITQQDLQRAGARDLTQVLTEQGGVYLNGSFSNPGKDKSVYLRGAKVDHTLIAIDGVPLYDASGVGSNFDLRLIPIESVERVEILRGSQGTLYGSDAIAGVINIITKKGRGKAVGADAALSYGSYNMLRASTTAHGFLKKFDYNIGVNHFKTDGISEAAPPPSATTAFDNDGFTQNALQAQVGIQATAKLRVQPYLRYTTIKGDLDQQAFVDEKDYTYDEKNLQAGIRNELTVGRARLNLLYNFNHIDRSYLDDSTKSRSQYVIFNDYGYKAAEHFAEAYVVYPFQKLTVTAGADLRASYTDYRSLTVSPPFSSDFPFPSTTIENQSGDSVHQQQIGVYGALNFKSRIFAAEAGARYNHHSAYGNNAAFNLNPSVLLHNRVKLFANLSSGYKTPSLYHLYSAYGNRALKPEHALNAEGGAQLFLAEGTLRAAYFYRDVKDVILFFLNPVTYQSQYINRDRQQDHGVEVETKWQLAKDLQLKLFYSFVDGHITTQSNGKDTTYFNLVRRPKHSATATLGYSFLMSAYVSVQAATYSSRSDVYYAPDAFTPDAITLKPYTLLNLYAEYGLLKKLKLFADLRNLTNRRYMEIYGYSAPRFNGYAGVRATF